MSKQHISMGVAAVTLALAGMASAADAPAGSSGKAVAANDTVHCYNVNSCKGTGDCKTATNACKGQNSCKGHGFSARTATACLSGGGVIGDL
jgi:hypothetical protein